MNAHELIFSSESNEWYTPAKYIETARKVLGVINLDPASCEYANRIVRADTYYTADDNGLSKTWLGNIWLNPPYGKTGSTSNQQIWSERLIRGFEFGYVQSAILLVNAVTGNQWFKDLWNYPICFAYNRIKFYSRENKKPNPTHGNCFVYFGGNYPLFKSEFAKYGEIIPARKDR